MLKFLFKIFRNEISKLYSFLLKKNYLKVHLKSYNFEVAVKSEFVYLEICLLC